MTDLFGIQSPSTVLFNMDARGGNIGLSTLGLASARHMACLGKPIVEPLKDLKDDLQDF